MSFIEPIEQQNQLKLIIYYTKFKTSNFIVKNSTNFSQTFLNEFVNLRPFRECLSENIITANIYIGHTTTTLSRHLVI